MTPKTNWAAVQTVRTKDKKHEGQGTLARYMTMGSWRSSKGFKGKAAA